MSLLISAVLLAVAGVAFPGSQSGRVIAYRNIALYPIPIGLSRKAANVITLDDGVKAGTIVITESGSAPALVRPRPGNGFRSNGFGGGEQLRAEAQSRRQRSYGAQVNTLWLTNTSGKTLLLIAGEMLLGGQQDRIVEKDGLIPPSKEPTDLSVFCVEHGRWTGTTAQFGVKFEGAPTNSFGGGAGGFAAPSGGRGAAVVAKSQGQVWESVAAQNRRLGTESETGTYRKNYISPKTQPMMGEYISALAGKFPVASSAGVVLAVNGRLVWMDRFDTPATFAKYWPKLLKSYVLEALADANGAVGRTPTYREAMHFATSRDGATTFEGSEGVSKLTKVENDASVLYELEDLQSDPPILVHASKAAKR